MSKTLISPEVFDSCMEEDKGKLTDDSIAMAREVLVEGKTLAEAGGKHNVSRQRVERIVKKIRARIEQVPAGWVRVEVWLPKEQAEAVQAMASAAKSALNRDS